MRNSRCLDGTSSDSEVSCFHWLAKPHRTIFAATSWERRIFVTLIIAFVLMKYTHFVVDSIVWILANCQRGKSVPVFGAFVLT